MKRRIVNDEQAVSPVIAVILMVAITVVLAAVLYVWASSFLGGTTKNAPTGSMIASEDGSGVWTVQSGLPGARTRFEATCAGLFR